MSKSSKDTPEPGADSKKAQDEELEHPIFCEKCRFIFQGENEFENHKCQQQSTSVVATANKVTRNTRRGRQTANEVGSYTNLAVSWMGYG